MRKENKIIRNDSKAKSLMAVNKYLENGNNLKSPPLRGKKLRKIKSRVSVKIKHYTSKQMKEIVRMVANREKENLWSKIKNKFQRDDNGRIIVPNTPAYGIIAVLIIIILIANAMLLRRSYAEEADNSWDILYTSTEDSMTILTHDYNSESVKQYKYRISSDGGKHWSSWQNENIFGLDTKVTGKYERKETGSFEQKTTFNLFKCTNCGQKIIIYMSVQ